MSDQSHKKQADAPADGLDLTRMIRKLQLPDDVPAEAANEPGRTALLLSSNADA